MRPLPLLALALLAACGPTTDVRRGEECASDAADTGNLSFVHDVVAFRTGDSLVTCSVTDSSTTYAQTVYYPANADSTVKALAATATCSLVYDVDTATFGTWVFTRPAAGGATTVRYEDPGSPSDGDVWTLNGCVVYAE